MDIVFQHPAGAAGSGARHGSISCQGKPRFWHDPLHARPSERMLISVILIAAGLGLLVIGADRFITGAAQTARALGISPMVIGLTVVGFATSMPEVLVGAVAAWDGRTGMAIGNAVGSNIANIGLVLAVAVLVRPMVVASATLRREYLLMCLAALLAILLLVDQHLGRLDGLILFGALIAATWWIVRLATRSPPADPLGGEFEKELAPEVSPRRAAILLGAGLLVLLAGAELLVRGAVSAARILGVSDLIIGLTVVAIGTSLPELAASVTSVLKNEADIAIGNVIGSNTFNMLMVLGIPALIGPSGIGMEVLTRDFAAMAVLTVLMGITVFIHGRGRFSRPEGGLLLAVFLGYQYLLFEAAIA
jgi:cation:H+ antiporter